jgi:hypothetical protein
MYLRKRKRQDARKKKSTQDNERSIINKTYCIAEGYDFGNLVGCPDLSMLEKILLAQYIFFGTLVKLNGWKGIKQNALRGHVIAFSHSGPNAINKVTHLLFPWFQIEEILDCIKVSFVGPSGVADRCLKALCIDGGLLRADIKPLAWWLGLLKACHPGYAHLVLPGASQEAAVQIQLHDMQGRILAGAQRVSSKMSKRIERKAGADIAAVRSLPEDHDGVNDDNADDSEIERDSNSSSGEDNDSGTQGLVDLDDPDFEQKLNFILSDTIIVDGTLSGEQDSTELLGKLLAMMTHNPDSSNAPKTFLHSVRSEEPINEFGNNDVLYYMAFPTLFIFGRGLPEGSSALPPKLVRHLLLQYHCRHAKDQRFYFSNFNQMQRHAASRAAVLRVKNSRPAIQEFIRLVQQDNIVARLEAAVENPDSDDAKLLTKQILPLITSFGSSIPYSPSERRDMFPHFVSSMYRFGTGFIFLSASFDDKRHCFTARLAIPSSSNQQFPALDHGFRAQMEKCADAYSEEGSDFSMLIDDVNLLRLASESPVAAVQFFKTLFHAFLDILLAIPPPDQLDTVPLNHPSRRGIFGIVTEISLVHETNGRYIPCYVVCYIAANLTLCVRNRGTLHFHSPLTGVLNPYLLQDTLHSPMFRKAIAAVYDSMITAELPMVLHVKYLLERSQKSLILSPKNHAAVKPGSMDIALHANMAAFDKNIHSSFHTDSCVSKFLPYCRSNSLLSSPPNYFC